MTAEVFLGLLFVNCNGFIETRDIPAKPGYRAPRQAFRKIGDNLERAVKQVVNADTYDEYNAYFGVATRATHNGTKRNIQEIPAVWVDLDFKAVVDPMEAVVRIRSFPLQPSAIIATGGGFHLYWFLKEPALPGDVPRVEAINRGLARILGGDLNSCDAARILRLPGTKNLKYNPPVEARVVDYFGQRYNLSDFDDYKQDEEQPAKAAVDNGGAFKKIFHWCAFMRHCQENAESLSEQHWYQMISNLSRVPGGVDKIHEMSRPYPKYKRSETNGKILKAINASEPITCKVIARDFRGCQGCKAHNDHRVGCPASVRFREDL